MLIPKVNKCLHAVFWPHISISNFRQLLFNENLF